MPKKIEKYAEEPIVFYLHKKRNFIKKINDSIIEEAKAKE
jgi:hypothetical protein